MVVETKYVLWKQKTVSVKSNGKKLRPKRREGQVEQEV